LCHCWLQNTLFDIVNVIMAMSNSNNNHKIRKKSSKLLLNQDVVVQVVQQLVDGGIQQLRMDNDDENDQDDNWSQSPLVRSTQEALRLLQTRVPVGRLGKIDRQELRVAVLIDHVLRRQRQENNNNKNTRLGSTGRGSGNSQETKSLQLQQVARVMRVKLKDLQQLHSIIGNYDYDLYGQQKQVGNTTKARATTATRATMVTAISSSSSSSNKPTKKKRSLTEALEERKRQQSQQQQQRPRRTLDCQSLLLHNNNNNNNNTANNNNILPDLIIRLSLYIRDDTARLLQKTQAALRDLVTQQHSTATKLSASERRGQEYDLRRFWPAYQAAMLYYMVTNTNGGSNAMTSGDPSNNNHNGSSEHTNHDEETSLALKLDHLCEASSAFTYMEVKEKLPFIQQWARDRKKEEEEQANKKKKKGACATTKNAKKAQHNDHDSSAMDDDEPTAAISFQEWKAHILEGALRDAAAAMDPSRKSTTTATRSECLQWAADKVLQKYGLQ